MTTDDDKYSRVEYERRFLVRADADWRAALIPGERSIDDKYLHDSRLRLRIVRDLATGERTIKLTKKAASPSPLFRTLSRILLTPAEYALFDRLDGDRLSKVRRHCICDGHRYAIDVFNGELAGLVLSELEADGLDELQRTSAPPFAEREVTHDPFFDGVNLARTQRGELLAKLASLRAS